MKKVKFWLFLMAGAFISVVSCTKEIEEKYTISYELGETSTVFGEKKPLVEDYLKKFTRGEKPFYGEKGDNLDIDATEWFDDIVKGFSKVELKALMKEALMASQDDNYCVGRFVLKNVNGKEVKSFKFDESSSRNEFFAKLSVIVQEIDIIGVKDKTELTSHLKSFETEKSFSGTLEKIHDDRIEWVNLYQKGINIYEIRSMMLDVLSSNKANLEAHVLFFDEEDKKVYDFWIKEEVNSKMAKYPYKTEISSFSLTGVNPEGKTYIQEIVNKLKSTVEFVSEQDTMQYCAMRWFGLLTEPASKSAIDNAMLNNMSENIATCDLVVLLKDNVGKEITRYTLNTSVNSSNIKVFKDTYNSYITFAPEGLTQTGQTLCNEYIKRLLTSREFIGMTEAEVIQKAKEFWGTLKGNYSSAELKNLMKNNMTGKTSKVDAWVFWQNSANIHTDSLLISESITDNSLSLTFNLDVNYGAITGLDASAVASAKEYTDRFKSTKVFIGTNRDSLITQAKAWKNDLIVGYSSVETKARMKSGIILDSAQFNFNFVLKEGASIIEQNTKSETVYGLSYSVLIENFVANGLTNTSKTDAQNYANNLSATNIRFIGDSKEEVLTKATAWKDNRIATYSSETMKAKMVLLAPAKNGSVSFDIVFKQEGGSELSRLAKSESINDNTVALSFMVLAQNIEGSGISSNGNSELFAYAKSFENSKSFTGTVKANVENDAKEWFDLIKKSVSSDKIRKILKDNLFLANKSMSSFELVLKNTTDNAIVSTVKFKDTVINNSLSITFSIEAQFGTITGLDASTTMTTKAYPSSFYQQKAFIGEDRNTLINEAKIWKNAIVAGYSSLELQSRMKNGIIADMAEFNFNFVLKEGATIIEQNANITEKLYAQTYSIAVENFTSSGLTDASKTDLLLYLNQFNVSNKFVASDLNSISGLASTWYAGKLAIYSPETFKSKIIMQTGIKNGSASFDFVVKNGSTQVSRTQKTETKVDNRITINYSVTSTVSSSGVSTAGVSGIKAYMQKFEASKSFTSTSQDSITKRATDWFNTIANGYSTAEIISLLSNNATENSTSFNGSLILKKEGTTISTKPFTETWSGSQKALNFNVEVKYVWSGSWSEAGKTALANWVEGKVKKSNVYNYYEPNIESAQNSAKTDFNTLTALITQAELDAKTLANMSSSTTEAEMLPENANTTAGVKVIMTLKQDNGSQWGSKFMQANQSKSRTNFVKTIDFGGGYKGTDVLNTQISTTASEISAFKSTYAPGANVTVHWKNATIINEIYSADDFLATLSGLNNYKFTNVSSNFTFRATSWSAIKTLYNNGLRAVSWLPKSGSVSLKEFLEFCRNDANFKINPLAGYTPTWDISGVSENMTHTLRDFIQGRFNSTSGNSAWVISSGTMNITGTWARSNLVELEKVFRLINSEGYFYQPCRFKADNGFKMQEIETALQNRTNPTAGNQTYYFTLTGETWAECKARHGLTY